MKIILACLICLVTSPVMGQWRMIRVSSGTDTAAITENFRRASLWSNRKLDRFGNDTVYGQPIFQNGIKFLDGTIQTTAVVSTGSFATSAQLTSTASAVTALENTRVLRAGDTMSGQLTNTSSVTITGNGGQFGLQVSSNLYVMGYSSASAYYGDGSHLTGVSTTGGSTSTASVSYKEQVSTSAWNGTANTLTLTNTPLPNSLSVSKNGVTLASIFDYTLSGATITFNTAPASSSTIRAYYAIADSSTSIYTATGTWTASQIINDLRSSNQTIFVSSLPVRASANPATGTTPIWISSVTITTYGEPVKLDYYVSCRVATAGNGLHALLIRDSTTIKAYSNDYEVDGPVANYTVPLSGYWIDSPVAGTYTYGLWVQTETTGLCFLASASQMQTRLSATRLH